MGRAPCCDKQGLKKGPWTPEEDKILVDYIQAHGHGIWRSLPKQTGLLRCGKSCRLRWINYLRPDIKRGPFTPEEETSIVQLHGIVGNKWSAIAAQLPGRTDNEVKNYWNTHMKKRQVRRWTKTEAFVPSSVSSAHGDSGCGSTLPTLSSVTDHMAQWESARLEAEARLATDPLLSSSSHATATPSADATAEPDVFLRIWHSDVGEAFRRRDGVYSTGASPCSSSTKHSISAPIRHGKAGPSVHGVEADLRGDAEELGRSAAAADSPSSNETREKTPEETYLSLMGGDDMALGCLLQEEVFGSFSWLTGDLGDEESSFLDVALK